MKQRFLTFIDRVDRHELWTLAGSIAYTTALALAPFIIITLVITSWLSDVFQAKVSLEFASLLGPQAAAAVDMVIENTKHRRDISTLAGVLGLVILAFSASAIFSQLRSALNKINEGIKDVDQLTFWESVKDRLLSMGLVIGFVFLAVVSLAVSSVLSLVFNFGEGSALVSLGTTVVNFVTFSLLFCGIYFFIPTKHMPLKYCFRAGAISSVAFIVGKNLIGAYIGNSAVSSAYGAAGTMIAFLIWVYYTSLILLASYEFVHLGVEDRDVVA